MSTVWLAYLWIKPSEKITSRCGESSIPRFRGDPQQIDRCPVATISFGGLPEAEANGLNGSIGSKRIPDDTLESLLASFWSPTACTLR